MKTTIYIGEYHDYIKLKNKKQPNKQVRDTQELTSLVNTYEDMGMGYDIINI